MIRSWFRSLVRTLPSGQPSRTAAAGRRSRVVLRLEAVEDRTVASAVGYEPPTLLTGPAHLKTPAPTPKPGTPPTDSATDHSTHGPDVLSAHVAPELAFGAEPTVLAAGADIPTAADVPVAARTATLNDPTGDESSSSTSSAATTASARSTSTATGQGIDAAGLNAGGSATASTPAVPVSRTADGVAPGRAAAAAPVPSAPSSSPASATTPAPTTSGPAAAIDVATAGGQTAGTPTPTTTSTSVPAGLPDGALLQRFVVNREQAAFGALVQRYGGMVLGVCQKVLGDYHAAQDASQATFMVLARKAGMLDRTTPLGGWLYKVAYHLALRTRAVAARQRLGEKEAAGEQPTATVDPGPAAVEQREIHQVLQEELERLPEKYRAPLTLCYVDGRSHADAAREIGLPRGSMAKRVGEGLERLRERLLHRGFSL